MQRSSNNRLERTTARRSIITTTITMRKTVRHWPIPCKYKVVKKPLHNIWLDLGNHGEGTEGHTIELMVEETKEDINNKNSDSMQQKHELTLIFKLGLLLHGPPGTGKMSMIKASVQLTGRYLEMYLWPGSLPMRSLHRSCLTKSTTSRAKESL